MADLQEDFGTVAGMGAILARDDPGALMNWPYLPTSRRAGPTPRLFTLTLDDKTKWKIEEGKKEEGVEWEPGIQDRH